MSGSKTNTMSREELLSAVRRIRPEQDYVWDGRDEDERPATEDELRAGVEAYRHRAQTGRRALDSAGNLPRCEKKTADSASVVPERIRVPLDSTVVEAFRATGPDWQARINQVLKAWISTHPIP